jgi:RNA polymerase sigma-70 factor (ECF subfamily)
MDERAERFARLFASAYGPVWAYARRRAAPADVDDLVSEVFTVAWRRLDDIPAEAELAWLYRVAFRALGNYHRSIRRRLALMRRLRAEPPSGETSEPAGVHEALASLKAPDREVLRLWAWEELGPAEAAIVLGCSAQAAASRLSRARKKLRAALTGSEAGRTHHDRKEIDV